MKLNVSEKLWMDFIEILHNTIRLAEKLTWFWSKRTKVSWREKIKGRKKLSCRREIARHSMLLASPNEEVTFLLGLFVCMLTRLHNSWADFHKTCSRLGIDQR